MSTVNNYYTTISCGNNCNLNINVPVPVTAAAAGGTGTTTPLTAGAGTCTVRSVSVNGAGTTGTGTTTQPPLNGTALTTPDIQHATETTAAGDRKPGKVIKFAGGLGELLDIKLEDYNENDAFIVKIRVRDIIILKQEVNGMTKEGKKKFMDALEQTGSKRARGV